MKHESQNWIKLLQDANLFVYGLARGTILLTPRSQKIWSLLQQAIDHEFVRHDIENVSFPALIPLTEMTKETSNFAGFAPEMFLVTQVGEKQLSRDQWLALRPTSEVVFSHYFRSVIRSYRDLPICINQWTNIWRWEKNTYPFLRTTEFYWQEGHAIFANRASIEQFFPRINQSYHTVLDQTALIPTVFGEKSARERFAGAAQTWTHETLLPDGQFLQLATTHDLGQQFSRIFDIQFLNEKNQRTFVEQASWGLSTRTLAAIFLTHADQKGLILPPSLADQQIWILPLKSGGAAAKKTAQTLATQLRVANYRVKVIDLQSKSMGHWIYQWEKFGIPLRIEIGANEVQKGTVTYATRAPNEKGEAKASAFAQLLPKLIATITETMRTRAAQRFLAQRQTINNWAEYIAIPEKNRSYLVDFCGEKSCEQQIQEKTQTTSRAIIDAGNEKAQCFHCSAAPARKTIFGRSY